MNEFELKDSLRKNLARKEISLGLIDEIEAIDDIKLFEGCFNLLNKIKENSAVPFKNSDIEEVIDMMLRAYDKIDSSELDKTFNSLTNACIYGKYFNTEVVEIEDIFFDTYDLPEFDNKISELLAEKKNEKMEEVKSYGYPEEHLDFFDKLTPSLIDDTEVALIEYASLEEVREIFSGASCLDQRECFNLYKKQIGSLKQELVKTKN